MIISRTPLRVSFVGGGSDLAAFYATEPEGGAVVSMAINKFVYIAMNRKFDNRVRVSYTVTEDVPHASELHHDIVRNSLKYFGEQRGIEVVSIADIPGKGTGLGSSSTFSVGLANALNAYQHGNDMGRIELAKLGAHIEIDLCDKPIGKQDHYAAAFGGLNFIRFEQAGSVKVEPIIMDLTTMIMLNERLLLFYTGRTRKSSGILESQQDGLLIDEKKRDITRKMAQLARKIAVDLNNNELDKFGEMLHRNWKYKKLLADEISDGEIDLCYQTAIDAGALGGKLCGAGGGGFLLFYALPDKQADVREAMGEMGLNEMPFSAHTRGSEIVWIG